MYRQSKLPLEDDARATNRSNRNDIAHADWADYKCAVLIRRSDFEAVYFTAYIYSKKQLLERAGSVSDSKSPKALP